MTEHEDYLELAAVHALGVLDGEDRVRFESHLATGCDECERALNEAKAVAGELAFAVTSVTPKREVRERLLERVRKDSSRPADQDDASPAPRKSAWIAWAAAGLVGVAGLGYYSHTLRQTIEAERASREQLEKELAVVGEFVEAFTAPRTQTVALAGRGPAPEATARAFVDPERGRVFLYVYNLPPLPPESTYQLWFIVGEDPISAGTFTVEADGNTRLDAEPTPSFEGAVTLAVTVEPSGGVPQPTGPMVLLGS